MTSALWFFDHGVGVFPVITPGKTPACASWDDYQCTRSQAARFRNYGVRLGRLIVVDTDTPQADLWVEAYIRPHTPFTVLTSRGPSPVLPHLTTVTKVHPSQRTHDRESERRSIRGRS